MPACSPLSSRLSPSPRGLTPEPWVHERKASPPPPPRRQTRCAFKHRLVELATTCHGSRILQEELNRLHMAGDSAGVQELVQAVVDAGCLADLCLDKFGNYFIQVLLAVVDDRTLTRLVQILTADASLATLCNHPYGSHVVQILISVARDNKAISSKLADSFAKAVVRIGVDYLGSICLVHAIETLPTSSRLIAAVAPHTLQLSLSRHGHGVMMKALERGSSQTLGLIETHLAKNLGELVRNDFGWRVVLHALELEKDGKVNSKYSRVRLFVHHIEFDHTFFKLINYIALTFSNDPVVEKELLPQIVEIVKTRVVPSRE